MVRPTRGTRAVRKIDKRLMQQSNRAMVLNLIRSDPQLSRAALARLTHLSPATLSGIVDHLLEEGLVREMPFASGTVGRPPLYLSLNPQARVALGIAIDVNEIKAALVDLGGNLQAECHATVPASASPEIVMDIAADLARQALAQANGIAVLGIGVAIPGMVTWPGGVNLFSPNLQWRNVPVRDMLVQRLSWPVSVDNEVRAVALAEHHFGVARDASTVVFLDVAYGVGGAIIIDGHLYRGMHGAAGEIGHNTVDPSGPICSCGNRGCVEVFTSDRGLLARAQEALAAGRTSILASQVETGLSVQAIALAAREGDELAGELLGRAATFLGLAVANAIDNWDPELVVLSGSVIRAGGDLFDDLLVTGRRAVLEPGRARVRITRAALGPEAKIVGAATLVISDYLAEPLRGGATILD